MNHGAILHTLTAAIKPKKISKAILCIYLLMCSLVPWSVSRWILFIVLYLCSHAVLTWDSNLLEMVPIFLENHCPAFEEGFKKSMLLILPFFCFQPTNKDVQIWLLLLLFFLHFLIGMVERKVITADLVARRQKISSREDAPSFRISHGIPSAFAKRRIKLSHLRKNNGTVQSSRS